MKTLKGLFIKYYNWLGIAIIAFFRMFYLMNGRCVGARTGDSNSYLHADLHLSALGRRVPIYPLFLKVCRKMTVWDEYQAGSVAAAIQCVLSAVILYFFFQIIKMITKNELISWLATIFYGCNVAVLIWDCAVMTESISQDFVILFFYMILKYLDTKKTRYGALTVMMTVLAAMTKPTCAVLVGVCIVLLVLQYIYIKDMRKTVLKVSAVLAAAILFLLLYCANTYRNYGVFNLTNLGPRHNLVAVLDTGIYRNYPDKELVAQIDEVLDNARAEGKNIRLYPTTNAVMSLFGEEGRQRNIDIQAFNKYCKKTDRKAVLKFKYENVKKYWDRAFEQTDWKLRDDVIEYSRIEYIIYYIQKYVFSSVHVRFGYIMMFVMLIIAIVKIVRKKEVAWYELGIAGSMLILIYAVVNNAYASFYRHMYFLLPFGYAGVSLILNDIYIFISKKK